MEKRKIRTPFFSVNPKAYIYGDASVALAKFTDQMAEKYDIYRGYENGSRGNYGIKCKEK